MTAGRIGSVGSGRGEPGRPQSDPRKLRPMAISVTCEECFSPVQAPDAAAGKKVRCPTCGSAVRVAAGGGGGAAPSRRRQRSAPAPQRSSGGGGVPVWLMATGGLFALLLVGGGMLALGMVLAGGDDGVAVASTGTPAEKTPAADKVPAADSAKPVPERAASPEPAASGGDAGEDAEAAPAVRTREKKMGAPLDAPGPRGKPSAGTSGNAKGGRARGKGAAPGLLFGDGQEDEDGGDVGGPKGTGETLTADAGELAPERFEIFSDEADLRELVMDSVVRIDAFGPSKGGLGSGSLVHPSGIVVTNYHVIDESNRIEVNFKDGRTFSSSGYLLVEPSYDIAIIKVDLPEDHGYPVLPVLRDLPRESERVFACGAPQGLGWSMTGGGVAGIRDSEAVENLTGKELDGTWIQTDAAVSSGNSGGPLIDRRGNIVAMNTLASSNSGQGGVSQNINFSISCVDIVEKLQSVLGKDVELKAWDPDNLTSYDRSIGRRLVTNEVGTNKGKRILATMSQIAVLPFGEAGGTDVWTLVTREMEKTIERAGLEVLYEEPERIDFAVMIVNVELNRADRKRGSQFQEVVLKAEVVVPDIEDKGGRNFFCRVWEEERVLGTVNMAYLLRGKMPRNLQPKLVQFFNDFRRKFTDAQDEATAGTILDDPPRSGAELAKEEKGLFEQLFRLRFSDEGEDRGRQGGNGRGKGGGPPRGKNLPGDEFR